MSRCWESFKLYIRKSLDCLEKMIRKNMDAKGASGEASDGNEDQVIGH